MACFGSDDIVDDDGNYLGCLMNDYPGCGSCSFCCYSIEEKDRDNAREHEKKWRELNCQKFYVLFNLLDGRSGSKRVVAPNKETAEQYFINGIEDTLYSIIITKQVINE